MQHHHVADCAIRSDGEGKSWIGVKYASILDVRSLTDGDQLIIAAQHRAEPNAGFAFEPDATEHNGVRRDPVLTISRQRDARVIEAIKRHWLLTKQERLKDTRHR